MTAQTEPRTRTDREKWRLWSAMHMWTVSPSWGGWHVLCDGRPRNWFPDFERAVNEARSRNQNEILVLQRLKDRQEVGHG